MTNQFFNNGCSHTGFKKSVRIDQAKTSFLHSLQTQTIFVIQVNSKATLRFGEIQTFLLMRNRKTSHPGPFYIIFRKKVIQGEKLRNLWNEFSKM